MVRRLSALLVIGVMTLSFVGASADAPAPELGVVNHDVAKVVSGKCVGESVFDAPYGVPEEADLQFPDGLAPPRPDFYKDNCVRLKIVFGPIVMKPGQNDVLIQPVTFEKPMWDGYLVRFKPDMVGAVSGFNSPRVKDAHLHHGTWLNAGRDYGNGPWIASGEEKTIALWPEGYGLKILGSDTWLFLHMIHNATAQPDVVYVTYDMDFIPAAVAEADADNNGVPNLVNTEGVWLDVGDCSWSDECVKDTLNPIFNVQRGFNADWVNNPNEHTLSGACVFPAENCSTINTFAERSAQQGVRLPDKPYDEETINQDGTLVMMGGHVHNGGLRDDVYLVRDGEAKLIHRSDAYYFDHSINWNTPGILDEIRRNPAASKIGAPPVSWDFVMSGVTADLGWRVKVKKGDKIRLEGIYDSTIASWYEQMGIVMTWFVPAAATWPGGAETYAQAVDPFDAGVTIHEGLNTRAVQPGVIDGASLPGAEHGSCTNSATTLCVRGQITHPRIETSGDHGNNAGAPLTITGTTPGENIPIGGFGYGPADNGVIRGTGMIPTVSLGDSVTFWNFDTADYMWHTITRCEAPCTASTTASYPIANGAWDDLLDDATGVTTANVTVKDVEGVDRLIPAGSNLDWILRNVGPDPMDFDSGQIGVGTGANQKLSWTFTPTRAGIFPFYCRIHPPMRGAIQVLPAS
jgi:plastocyanin